MNNINMLLCLSIAVAVAARTVTKEEVFVEFRNWCHSRCKDNKLSLPMRKICYLFTCQYCFSHWVAGLLVLTTGWTCFLPKPFGWVIGWLSLVGIANIYLVGYEAATLGVKALRQYTNRD